MVLPAREASTGKSDRVPGSGNRGPGRNGRAPRRNGRVPRRNRRVSGLGSRVAGNRNAHRTTGDGQRASGLESRAAERKKGLCKLSRLFGCMLLRGCGSMPPASEIATALPMRRSSPRCRGHVAADFLSHARKNNRAGGASPPARPGSCGCRGNARRSLPEELRKCSARCRVSSGSLPRRSRSRGRGCRAWRPSGACSGRSCRPRCRGTRR